MKRSRILTALISVTLTAVLTACSAIGNSGLVAPTDGMPNYSYSIGGNEKAKYEQEAPAPQTPSGVNNDPEAEKLVENKFTKTADEPVSTFSADVDTASYSLFRRLVQNNYSLKELISTAGGYIRTEELINYFRYDGKKPGEGELFGVSGKLVDCPWNENSKLLILGLQTEKPEVRAENNLVFLVDISGSMNSEDKLPLLQKTFSYLTSNLTENDTVSIVTYASGEKVVLEGCAGNKAEMIQKAIDSLKAQGATNGEAGLKTAYQLAEKYYKPDGNNRIILASDGDYNVGMSSVEEIEKFVSEKKKSGVFISVLGFGYGNYRDSIMETIADKGNGVYYYIDSETEAEKIFGDDLLSTLYTVAKDVKLQLTFDADSVSSYRLIGYENRMMSAQDFDNDTKDAGELGAGHSIAVCYELYLNEGAGKICDLSVRYKQPDGEKSELNEYSFTSDQTAAEADADTDLIAALCELGMILHESEYGSGLDLNSILALLDRNDYSNDRYRAQFVSLVRDLAGSGK